MQLKCNKKGLVKGILLKAIYSFDDSTARKFVQNLFSKYTGFFSKVAFDFININYATDELRVGRSFHRIGVLWGDISYQCCDIISQSQWIPYFERSAHFQRKNYLLMKEDLSKLDDFSTVTKLHYLKGMTIPKLWNAKFGLVKVTETSNIEASFHLHSCSAKGFLKICQNSQEGTRKSLFF